MWSFVTVRRLRAPARPRRSQARGFLSPKRFVLPSNCQNFPLRGPKSRRQLFIAKGGCHFANVPPFCRYLASGEERCCVASHGVTGILPLRRPARSQMLNRTRGTSAVCCLSSPGGLAQSSERSSSEGFAVLRSESIHGQAATIFACWGELFKIFVASGGAPQAGEA